MRPLIIKKKYFLWITSHTKHTFSCVIKLHIPCSLEQEFTHENLAIRFNLKINRWSRKIFKICSDTYINSTIFNSRACFQLFTTLWNPQSQRNIWESMLLGNMLLHKFCLLLKHLFLCQFREHFKQISKTPPNHHTIRTSPFSDSCLYWNKQEMQEQRKCALGTEISG